MCDAANYVGPASLSIFRHIRIDIRLGWCGFGLGGLARDLAGDGCGEELRDVDAGGCRAGPNGGP